MRNEFLMVEHTDKRVLEEIRRLDKRFKRRRIASVLQCRPSEIEQGVVYILGTYPIAKSLNQPGFHIREQGA